MKDINSLSYYAKMKFEVGPYKNYLLKPSISPLCYKTSLKDKWFVIKRVGIFGFIKLYKFEKQHEGLV